MRNAIERDGAVLAIVGPAPAGRLSTEEWEELTQGLVLIASFPDGLFYAGPP